MTDLAELVTRSLDPATREEFDARVREQTDFLYGQFEEGALDNEGFAIGLEMEVYAVAGQPEDGEQVVQPTEGSRLHQIPGSIFEDTDAVSKELGLHNAEINTDPNTFDAAGLDAQATAIEMETRKARAAAGKEHCALVLDAMWTIPPESGAVEYLSATTDLDGVRLATNMRTDPRYVAIDNDLLERTGGSIELSVPGVEQSFPTILLESLATSIQPHLQIPQTAAFPEYYNAAIRTMGPLVALASNSPFLPADLYGDVADPERLLDETHHELRIAVFEQSVNVTPNPKVRVPPDLDTVTEVVDHVREDDVVAPFLSEWLDADSGSAYTDNYWEFEHKRGTYWRWVRCVIGGDPVDGAGDERSVRIEYRPLPTQPTVADVVGLQALTAGLIRGLVAADHPITELPWEAAESAFYAAARDGLDGELAWVTADGDRTADPDEIFAEVFEYAEHGLEVQGIDGASYLDPIRARWRAETTPSSWKKARVREHLEDGLDFQQAIERMQREYIRRSRETDSFAEWL
ncbi:hypothetical protein [Halapricum hydrolyticum]|uniref:Glutamate--cysteine ligase n=1 Tax=Halapricum hydrolyticum TaxID=2979991 RepID=A0AAE3LIY1_9EURY|nr:hypothetical protein [Halapricum hydrolyticum]MCU4717703.1 hypothetical protein [Halapricum hydrolyticum]MCU4726768.1 hypothetical protein [Halapricum hydrolyticum]